MGYRITMRRTRPAKRIVSGSVDRAWHRCRCARARHEHSCAHVRLATMWKPRDR